MTWTSSTSFSLVGAVATLLIVVTSFMVDASGSSSSSAPASSLLSASNSASGSVSSGSTSSAAAIPPTPAPTAAATSAATPPPPTASNSGSTGQTGQIENTEEYQNLFNSPFYNDSDSLVSAKSTALGAAFISGVTGNPLNSAHVARSTTLLGICKPWQDKPLPLSQLPFVLKLGNHGTRYYAGAAVINPLFLGVLSGVLGLVCFIFAKATDVSFQEATRKLRFPNTLAFPYVFLVQPSTMCAFTVLLNSDDLVLLIFSGLGFSFWVVSVGLVGFFVYKQVGPNARYVENYRHETLDSKAQKKLIDACSEIDLKRQQREEERRGERDTDKATDAQSTFGNRIKEGTTGLFSGIAGILATMARDEEEEKRLKDEEDAKLLAEAEEDSDEELLNLIEKQAQFEYARMLSISLDDTAADDEGALQQVLKGAHRWVDFAHNDEEEDDDNVETVDVVGIHPSIGFVRRYGLLFAKFRRRATYFLLVELCVSFLCGILEGWRPANPTFNACIGPAVCLCILMAVYLVAVLVMRPMISIFEHVFNVFIALLQFVASCFVLVSITQEVAWAKVTTYVIAVGCVYMCALKSLMDLYAVIAPHLVVKALNWTSIKPLTRAYLDTANKGSGRSSKRKEMDARRQRALSRIRDDLEVSHNVEGDDPLDGTVDGTPPPAGQFGRRQSMVAGTDEGLDQSHGDAKKSINDALAAAMKEEGVSASTKPSKYHKFASSKGVPESLHPFAQRPLPVRPTMPQRSATESARRLALVARKKRRDYWAETLGAFEEGSDDDEAALPTNKVAASTTKRAKSPPPGAIKLVDPSATENKKEKGGVSFRPDVMSNASKMSASSAQSGVTPPTRSRPRSFVSKEEAAKLSDASLFGDGSEHLKAEDGEDLSIHDDALRMDKNGLLSLEHEDRYDRKKLLMVARKKREAKVQSIFGTGHNKPPEEPTSAKSNWDRLKTATLSRHTPEEPSKKTAKTSTTRWYDVMDRLAKEHHAEEKRTKAHTGASLTDSNLHRLVDDNGNPINAPAPQSVVYSAFSKPHATTAHPFQNHPHLVNNAEALKADSVPLGTRYATTKTNLKAGIIAIPKKPGAAPPNPLPVDEDPFADLGDMDAEEMSLYGSPKKKEDDDADSLDDFFDSDPDDDPLLKTPQSKQDTPPKKDGTAGADGTVINIVNTNVAVTGAAQGGLDRQESSVAAVSHPGSPPASVSARDVWDAMVAGRARGRERHEEEKMRQGNAQSGAFAGLSQSGAPPPSSARRTQGLSGIAPSGSPLVGNRQGSGAMHQHSSASFAQSPNSANAFHNRGAPPQGTPRQEANKYTIPQSPPKRGPTWNQL